MKIEKFLKTIKKENNQKIILFFFSFSYFLFGSFLIHFIFNKNLGIFGNDSVIFHELASKISDALSDGNINIFAEKFKSDGPQFPAFLAGIIYYIFGHKDPNFILFFNVFLYSCSICFFYSFFLKISNHKLCSVLFIMPMLFFPSAFGIVSEIIKGVFYFFGFSILCYSFSIKSKLKYVIIFISTIVLFAVRPNYFFYLPFVGEKISSCFYEEEIKTNNNSYLNEIEQLAKTLNHIREDKNSMECTSNFNEKTLPSNASELIHYIPKGFLIGLLKPYPNEWFSSESKTNGSFWIIASFETIFMYIGLILFPFGLYKQKNKKGLIFISILCLILITAYGTISFNLGYLYRVRFLFSSILVGIGYSYIPYFFKKKHLIFSSNAHIQQ